MLKRYPVFIICFLLSAAASAQKISVRGNVRDTSSITQVRNAVVTLITPTDSVLKGFARVKEDGSYEIKNIAPGKYVLNVSHPLFADYVDEITFTGTSSSVPPVSLTPKSKLLAEVIIRSGNPIRIKGDTTIYTADSFRVAANANVEELLKKLPGIQVDKNGQIKAMGETVERVLVDGEEFFGDDPGMAVKNLRADAVKEVQVFDKKSEQAEFTGIDDGKTQKTINLKLKEDAKRGYFGKIDLAGGAVKDLDPRYTSNVLLSSFRGKRKLSGFLLSGNTDQDRVNWEDRQKYGIDDDNTTMTMDDDGGMMIMSSRGSGDDEPYLDAQNGFMRSLNTGLQYSNKWTDKHTLSISPRYASQDYQNTKSGYRRTLLPGDKSLNEQSRTLTDINRYNMKLSATYELKLDSANTLKIVARKNFFHSNSSDTRSAVTKDEDSAILNTSFRDFDVASDKNVASGNLIFKHKFKKARRTLSASADWRSTETEGRNFLQSNNVDVKNNVVQNIDQMKDYDRRSTTAAAKLSYTEPLGVKYAMEIGYEVKVTDGKNDETTYTRGSNGKFETPVDSLTNNFDQHIFENSPSLKLNYSHKKLKANIGAGVTLSDFSLKDITFSKVYERDYTNFFPFATFNWSYKSNHSLRFNYNGTTRQPTINQLQPLRNNNDFFNEYIGNPDLRPSFSHGLNLSHNGYNFLTDTWMYQSLYANFTANAITSNRTILDNGKVITRPENTDGNYNIGFWSGRGSKIKKWDLRYDIGPNLNFSRYGSLINGITVMSKSLAAGVNVGLSKSKDKKYDVSLNTDLDYNRSSSAQNPNVVSYFSNTLYASATGYHDSVWSLRAELNWYTREGIDGVPAFSNPQVNLRLQRTFKKDEFTAYVTVRDLLNKNLGLDRNFYENVFTETRNDRLKRYCMIGFAWNFKNKTAAPAPTK